MSSSSDSSGRSSHASETKSKHRKQKEKERSSAHERRAETVADRPYFARAIRMFLEEHRTIESSRPLEDAMAEIEKASKLNEVFQVPIRHQLLNLEGALRFLLFLSVAVPDKREQPFSGSAKFSSHEALEVIAKVYDDGVQDGVWAFVDGAFEEDSDSDSGSEEPEEHAGSGKGAVEL